MEPVIARSQDIRNAQGLRFKTEAFAARMTQYTGTEKLVYETL